MVGSIRLSKSRSQEDVPPTPTELDQYRAKNKEEADSLITSKLPEMILQYKELLESEEFSINRLIEGDILLPLDKIIIQRISKDTNYRIILGIIIATAALCFIVEQTPPMGNIFFATFVVAVYYFIGALKNTPRDDNFDIVSNKKLEELAKKLQPILNQHRDDLRKLFLWVSLQVPRIMDGNNFGVHVQELIIKKVAYVTAVTDKFIVALSDLKNKQRSDIAYDMSLHTNVKAYKQAIQEIDMTEFLQMRYYMCNLRDDLNILHDLIMKNKEKIDKPRGETEGSGSMY